MYQSVVVALKSRHKFHIGICTGSGERTASRVSRRIGLGRDALRRGEREAEWGE